MLIFVVPISPADVTMLPKKKAHIATLICLLVIGGLLFAFDGIYVGVYTFGIYKISLGFAFLSSIQIVYVHVAVYLIRFLAKKIILFFDKNNRGQTTIFR